MYFFLIATVRTFFFSISQYFNTHSTIIKFIYFFIIIVIIIIMLLLKKYIITCKVLNGHDTHRTKKIKCCWYFGVIELHAYENVFKFFFSFHCCDGKFIIIVCQNLFLLRIRWNFFCWIIYFDSPAPFIPLNYTALINNYSDNVGVVSPENVK